MDRQPKIAILRWEQGLVPKGLMQLEALAGNSTNPISYPFPVKLVEVKGACTETVITHPSKQLLADMIEISKKLIEEEGIRGISASCGFNAIFQKEMADALDVPVFLSSILQVPYVQTIIGANKAVGVITAMGSALTRDHFRMCNVSDDVKIHVFGLENCKEWNSIFEALDNEVDLDVVRGEILATAKAAIEEHPEIGAIVLECTDLPPFAQMLREELGIPVFDFNSMMSHVAMSLSEMTNY